MIGVAPNPALVELLRDKFGVAELPEDRPPTIARERHIELAKTLRDEHGYQIYGFVVATHFPARAPDKKGEGADTEHFEVVTSLRTVGAGTKLAVWRVRLEPGQTMPSLVALYAGADWQEREQFDLVGVVFEGHPDLRRIMMPDDWEGHPLRKDYAIETACPPWR